MKRLIAILLSAALLIACLPLTAAAAKETSIEQKFRLLLDDMEIAYGAHRPDSSYYKELAQNDAWVLFRGGMNDPNAGDGTPTYRYATVGNKLIASHIASEPFKSGYGVYDKGSGAFYDLTVAWERGFGGLYDAWNALPSDAELARECSAVLIGDADGDGKVNILDATRIQRVLAKLDADTSPGPDSADFFYGWPIAGVCDYDRDGKVTVLDATSIQRCLVSLPKIPEFSVLTCARTEAAGVDPAAPSSARLIRNPADEFDFTNRFGGSDDMLTLFYDDPSFRKNNVMIGAFVRFAVGNSRVKSVDRLSLGGDGVLTVDVTCETGESESPDWMILIGLSRAYGDEIRDVELNIIGEPAHEIFFDAHSAGWDDVNYVGFHFWSIDDDDFTYFDWGAKRQRGVSDGDGIWRYDTAWNGVTFKPGKQYAAVFYNDRGEYTCNLLFDITCLGDTAYADRSSLYEGTAENDKHLLPAYWRGQDPADFGPEMTISYTGKVQGTCLPRGMTKKGLLFNFITGQLPYARLTGLTDQELIDSIGAQFGLTADEVAEVIFVAESSGSHAEWSYIRSDLHKEGGADAMTAVVAPITGDSIVAPADLNANGWHRPDAEKITVSAPYHDDMGEYWSEKLPAPELNNCDGYVLLIPDRASLEAYLPGFDSEGQYDDAFFERYAILGMIGQGTEENDTAELSYLAVKGDTLYAYAYIQSHYATDEWGEPVLEPTAPVVWTFRRVSKSDVEGVSQIGFWRYIYPAVGGAIYLTQGSVIEQYADASGFIREESEAILINRSSDVAPAIEGLYLDEFGSSVERGDHRFEVESWTDSDFEARSVIALRVYADDLQKETFSVTGVKRTGEDELTVSIQRSIPADHDLNEGVRFIFVAIPNYGKDHTVKVNITDIYENYNGFKVNFYTDGVTGEKTAGIRGYAGDNPRVTIPDHFGDYTVTSIAFDAFSGNRVIETVTIPDTVTYIGERAFKNCSNLKSVFIPLTVERIPNFAFSSCTNLENVYFYPSWNAPAALTSIGDSAFHSCVSLTSFQIPDSVTRISGYAFSRCSSLTQVVIPKSVEEIWGDVFGEKGENFTIYGYKDTAAQLYAEDYGFAFIPLDGTGELDYTVIDRRYPSAKMTYPDDEVGLYVTSPEELTAVLERLYLDADNVSQRPNDPEAYAAETLDEEWFKTHDLIAVRTLNEQWERIGVKEIYAAPRNVITVSLVIQPDDYTGDDPEGNWCYLMIGIDKRDLGDGDPQVTVNVGYYPEPLKPIIYLYPTEETELTVTLGKPDELTCTYPAYGDGWHVTAQPDGTLIGESGRSYYALYWESKSKTVAGMNDGFVVKGADTAKFFEEKLAILGLSEREAQEFIVYWLPLMQDNPYNLIRFATAAEIDQIMPLRFSVQPDSVIRILMEYKPLEEPVDIPEQTLSTPERCGFVAVEWGGTVMK